LTTRLALYSVKAALDKAKLNGLSDFSRKFIFRKCEKCGLLNIVKEDWYICAACDEALSKAWNFS